MKPKGTGIRIEFIDVARFYGILLVYYGHFIESLMKQKIAAAAVQYKFIYSFHMPLFFILAGYVAKEITEQTTTGQYLLHRLRGRIVPYIFFATILIIPTFFMSGHHGALDLSTWQGYLGGLKATFSWGLPVFNIPTWFLLSIFAVEILHLMVGRFITNRIKCIAAILFFYCVGSWFCSTFDLYNPLKGRLFSYFYFQEALVVYAFFLLGGLLKKENLFQEDQLNNKPIFALFALPLLLITFFTYNLNGGKFTFSVYDAVVMLFSSHGHIFWFALTAVAGSLCILSLARAFSAPRFCIYLGGNTLVLFCLNGFFYHFVNDRLAKLLAPHIAKGWEVALVGVVVTLLSLAIAAPFIFLCNTYLPWVVGRKKGKVVNQVAGVEIH